MTTKILFHSHGNGKHCPDGFAAAMVAWRVFGNNAEYIPCVYQGELPIIEEGDTVFILDFSFPRGVMIEWASRADITVLDHHKTAQANLEGLDFAIFDMERSGAQMAWDKWFGEMWGEVRPELIEYVADRDLWKKELPHTEEVHLALSSFPQDFIVWDTLCDTLGYVDFMTRIGAPLLEKRSAEIKELVDSAQYREFAGHSVLSTNTNNYGLVSDALNQLCKINPLQPFAFNFWEKEGVTKYELRSVGDFDVSAIAKRFGGGGHFHAAGCSIAPNPAPIGD